MGTGSLENKRRQYSPSHCKAALTTRKDPRVAPGPARPRQQMQTHQRRQLEDELQHARGKDGIRQHPHRSGIDIDRGDQAEIEDYRGDGRYGKPAVRVQHAPRQGGERDKHEVREGPAQQVCPELAFLRIRRKTRGEQPKEQRRREAAHERNDAQHAAERAEHHGHQIDRKSVV